MDYKRYFNGISQELKSLTDTKTITDKIKTFTKKFFESDPDKMVYYSGNPSEFLYDISVLSFNPKDIIENNNNNNDIIINSNYKKYNSFLLLESELGGVSASSPKGVFKNVVEDFSKLLIGNSKYKIMIMALSPYSKEKNYKENRLEILKRIYINSNCNSDMLIVVIEGDHNGKNSNQIKLDTSTMYAYILNRKGITDISS